jgi:hypothetical protein
MVKLPDFGLAWPEQEGGGQLQHHDSDPGEGFDGEREFFVRSAVE